MAPTGVSLRARPACGPAPVVEVLRWPAEAGRRGVLLGDGRCCLWVLAPGELPPELGPREDWVREPIDERDVSARVQRLAGRHGTGHDRLPGPIATDPHGLLVHRGRRVVVPPVEAILLDRLGSPPDQVVLRSELIQLAWPGRTRSPRAIDSRIHTLRGRIAPLHLSIHTIRGRGFLMSAETPVSFVSAARLATPRSDQWSNS